MGHMAVRLENQRAAVTASNASCHQKCPVQPVTEVCSWIKLWGTVEPKHGSLGWGSQVKPVGAGIFLPVPLFGSCLGF